MSVLSSPAVDTAPTSESVPTRVAIDAANRAAEAAFLRYKGDPLNIHALEEVVRTNDAVVELVAAYFRGDAS
jgi:hypothetical protein